MISTEFPRSKIRTRTHLISSTWDESANLQDCIKRWFLIRIQIFGCIWIRIRIKIIRIRNTDKKEPCPIQCTERTRRRAFSVPPAVISAPPSPNMSYTSGRNSRHLTTTIYYLYSILLTAKAKSISPLFHVAGPILNLIFCLSQP